MFKGALQANNGEIYDNTNIMHTMMTAITNS